MHLYDELSLVYSLREREPAHQTGTPWRPSLNREVREAGQIRDVRLA